MAAEYRVSAQEITPEERSVQGVRGAADSGRVLAHSTAAQSLEVSTEVSGVSGNVQGSEVWSDVSEHLVREPSHTCQFSSGRHNAIGREQI